MNAITTKIKIIGALLSISMLSIILITIYLNEKNIQDSKVVNISGKHRMLSQKLSKNIFYLYYNYKNENKKLNFEELNTDIKLFEKNLNFLENFNKTNKIIAAPKHNINKQYFKVKSLWISFKYIIDNFKNNIVKVDINKNKLKLNVNEIYNTNKVLLNEIDILVGLYESHIKLKTSNILKFQYIASLIMFILMIYSLFQLKAIENHAKEFIQYSKNLVNFDKKSQIKPIDIKAESEILEVTSCLNSFIDKINEAMEDSNKAIAHSFNASKKLENITDEFDSVLNDLENSNDIASNINFSEDIVIESTEELIKSTRKLQHLKDKLDNIVTNCKINLNNKKY